MFGKYHARTYWFIRGLIVNQESKNPYILRKVLLFFLKRCDSKYGGSIATFCGGGVKFKSAPYLVHELTGVFIAPNAVIGENCTIFQNVTIGIKSLDDMERNAPIIGNNCLIGAGACILGGVKVGDNVRIGANAVVVKDIPSNVTVVCAYPRIIKR